MAATYHTVVNWNGPGVCLFVGSVTRMDLECVVVQTIVELCDLVRLHRIMVLRKLAQLQWFRRGPHLELGFKTRSGEFLIYKDPRLEKSEDGPENICDVAACKHRND